MAGTTESKLEYLIKSKEDVRLAINRMLVPCPEDTPFLEYGPKIKQVDVDLSDATVTSDDVMEGIIAYDSKEQRLVGTIPDLGPLNFEPSDEEYIIPYGRTDGGKVNKADITKLAEYEACLRIANSVDNLDDYSDTTATPEDIVIGKTAYSNGERIVGVMPPPLDTTQLMSCYQIFKNNTTMTSIIGLNTVNVNSMYYMCYGCSALEEVDGLNSSNCTDMYYMFGLCSKLRKVGLMDMGKVTNLTEMFYECTNLVDLGGFKDLGKAFYASKQYAQYYTLNLEKSKKLTHESLMNVINNLYDLNLSYDVANGGTLYKQYLKIGSTNKAKLTADEIAIATNKGWYVL